MKTAFRNRIIIVLSVLLVFSVLSFAFTKARYSEEKNPDNHLGELEYTIANQVEIHNTEEFFSAVQNGYSNVKLADNVSDPFLVSGSTEVKSDLILDLNGHQIQRISREPMLTVTKGVKMIVADTSSSQKGSFYNPVGSVLKIDGGVLTVMSNTFESGPRDNEYYKNKDITGYYIGGTVSQSDTIQVTFKNGAKNSCDDTPILLPTVSTSEGSTFINGNIYFDTVPSETTYNTDLVKADTYFYFMMKDKNASTTALAASTADADFHYTYYVKRAESGDYTYAGPTKTNDTTDIEVTIYGYHNVIASAKNEVAPYNDPTRPSNFAAIKMIGGSMYSRGGMFYSYFGVESSSCIYADEGTLFVYDGTYTAIDEGVAVKCNYLLDSSEFTIIGGNFKSYKGDIIQMTNGNMTITGGTFVKDSSSFTDADAGSNSNNSAINLKNGTMYLNSAQDTPINFYLAGHYMAAIKCGANAQIDSIGVNYEFGTINGKDSVAGGNNIGILSEGGNVNVTDCVFIQPGDYSYGIYSYDKTDVGTHQSLDVISTMFSMGGERSTGIYSNGGIINIGCETDLYKPDREQSVYGADGNPLKDQKGNPVTGVSIDNYTIFYLDHVANCYGVYVEKRAATASTFAADTRINVYAGQFIVGSGYDADDNPYASIEIPGNQRLNGNGTYVGYEGGRELTATTLQEEEKVWSAGVYLNDPSATVSLGKVRMILGGSYTAGIFAEQGHLTKLYNEETDKSYNNGTAMAENEIPTTVLFVGTRMVGYQNGGYISKDATEKNKKWNYLYKHDYDYIQTSEFGTYYDRIQNCNSSDDYGIAAKAGSVTVGRIYVNVRGQFSRGIYATSSGSSVSSVKLENFIANIDNRDLDNRFPSVFDTTTMTIRNGSVEIDDGDIRTNGVGVVINNGQLTLNGIVNFQSINASAIYMTSTTMVSGGTTGPKNNLTINESADISIFCNIREKGDDLTAPTPWKLKNVHNRTYDESKIPQYTDANKSNEYYMVSYNGINVKGGSVTCNGKLTLDFHGVNNKNQTAYDPYNIPLAGSAINVEQLTGSDQPRVDLWHAHVTAGKAADKYGENDFFYANRTDISESNGGGGISVKGGNVYLGKEDDKLYTDPTKKEYEVLHKEYNGDYNKLITIETFGQKRYRKADNSYDYKDGDSTYDNWKYAVSETGGPGIKVESGNIIVKHGTYYASQGNGILLVGGEAEVYSGIFKGKNTEWTSDEGDKTGSGLGSYYGFMLRGGGNLTIYDGLFEGFNGGAFITGSETSNAVANVYGGTFEDMPERRDQRETTNGFSVGPYAAVTIGKENPTASDVAPKIMGIACGIAVENNKSFGGVGLDKVTITVQGGAIVRATKLKRSDSINAIWKGNSQAVLIFGECTLLLQNQVKDDDGTYSDSEMLQGEIINNDSRLWGNAVDVSTYNIYYQIENGELSEMPGSNSVNFRCSKVVITKQKLLPTA